jgi:hypothetical protein
VVAAVDIAIAQEALTEAQRLGSGEENVIADAFVLLFSRNDKPAAHAKLAELNTPMSRSAGFLVAAHGETPDIALKWLTDTETRFIDLDPDGKQQVLARRIQAGDWTGALTDVESLADTDFETTPVLLVSAATVNLAHAIHKDLRGALSNLLSETDTFPLGADASSIAFRAKARALYEKAADSFAALACDKAAGSAADHALWLSLRDPATADAARRELEASMADPRLRLRRLPMALAFGLKLDLASVEREIDRETTLSGGKSIEAAIARFAVANMQREPGEFAAYIADHRAQLIQYYNPQYIDALEIELLARSGQTDEARSKLVLLQDKEMPAQALTTLSRVIDEAAGADGVAIREQQYATSGAIADLYSLVQLLKERRAYSKLAVYGKALFEGTKDLPSAEIYVDALYEQGQNQEITELAIKYPELVQGSEILRSVVPWAYYRHGDLLTAKALHSKFSVSRDIPNDRLLFVNIAIAAGDWNSLGTFVESEWTNRNDRDAVELLRAGQLAQRIGATGRSQELIREAAAKADGNPYILAGCYSAATSAGWEDDPAIHEWLRTAIEASGEDGPIQKADLREILDRQPDWNEHEQRMWDALLSGSVPMFAAARALKRTLLEMYLVPALSNLNESDPRKRGLIFSFSGARPLVRPPGKRWGLDVTSIFTLSLLGLLETVIDASDSVTIAHTTLGWLFQEREDLQFHQPSRVRDALEIKRLLDSGSLQRFDGVAAPAALEHEVGHEMARYLVAATTIDEPESAQKIVIRPYPLHKPETFMDEVADISGYEKHIAGCIDLIAALHKLGRITAAEEQRARSYLALHERPWPHTPGIETGATLFLDSLAVTYLQHIGLLERLKQAGFTVFISGEEIDTDNALVRYEAMGDRAKRIIENIRDILARNISTGKISLTPLAERDPDEPFELRQHPTMVLFDRAQNIDSFVIDDRFQNQHTAIGTSYGERSVLTSIDLVLLLAEEKLISTAEFMEDITTLRRAGLLLVPHRQGEILELINSATVVDEQIQETAELRAVREALLRAQMTDTLQLPRESVWLDGLARQLIDAIRAQWNNHISDEVARARSYWLLSLLDTRGWSHRIPEDGPSVSDRYRTMMLALLILPDASNDVRERYWRWFEDAALAQFREESPDDYGELVARIEALITKRAEEVAQGGTVG